MRILVIPDVHLKPRMFEKAAEILKNGLADRTVCLMDIADDWGKQYQVPLYEATYDAAISFAKAYPETLWCYGNHDVSYLWNKLETGFSPAAHDHVIKKLSELRKAVPEGHLAFVHRIDNVLFSHAGLTKEYVQEHFGSRDYDNPDKVIAAINRFGVNELWKYLSPIWVRPQEYRVHMYKPRKFLHVVGHTPVKQITRRGSLVSCDVFSTYSDGTPIGTQEFPIIDTDTWQMLPAP